MVDATPPADADKGKDNKPPAGGDAGQGNQNSEAPSNFKFKTQADAEKATQNNNTN